MGFWFLNTTFFLKKPRILGEMADSRTGLGKHQDNPGIILSQNVSKCTKNDRGMSKGPGIKLKEIAL